MLTRARSSDALLEDEVSQTYPLQHVYVILILTDFPRMAQPTLDGQSSFSCQQILAVFHDVNLDRHL